MGRTEAQLRFCARVNSMANLFATKTVESLSCTSWQRGFLSLPSWEIMLQKFSYYTGMSRGWVPPGGPLCAACHASPVSRPPNKIQKGGCYSAPPWAQRVSLTALPQALSSPHVASSLAVSSHMAGGQSDALMPVLQKGNLRVRERARTLHSEQLILALELVLLLSHGAVGFNVLCQRG